MTEPLKAQSTSYASVAKHLHAIHSVSDDSEDAWQDEFSPCCPVDKITVSEMFVHPQAPEENPQWAQLGRIVYGAGDEKRGFMRYGKTLLHPSSTVEFGILHEECGQLLKEFFRNKREV